MHAAPATTETRSKAARGNARTPWAIYALAAGRAERHGRGTVWPSTQYQQDPVAFAREVLGIEPWSKQVEILEAVRDHKRVTVRSGHKCGKSTTLAMLALWFFCSFPDARVVMTSVTSRQVDAILFREVKKLRARAKRPIDGEAGELARTGIKASDFREIVGFTAKEAEAVAGISGPNLMYLCDEASGIPQPIFSAIEGNRAGGARIVLTSNPTKTEGEFFESHEKLAYHRIHVSSEHSPNVIEGREVVPGLAGREWVEEKLAEWGEDSPLFKVRVRGEFVRNEEGKILPLHALELAEQRWSDTVASGPLQIGIDPAGPGENGDESVFVLRRGLKHLATYAFRGLSDEAHLAHLLGMLKEHSPTETALVVLDREGPVGWDVWSVLRRHAETTTDFRVVGLRASDKATREPHLYHGTRDELWARAAEWLKSGGALIEDAKLARDLHAPSWHGQLNGKLKATDKKTLKKDLGRSPDRGDALCLAVWEVRGVEDERTVLPAAPPTAAVVVEDAHPFLPSADPYDGLGVWGRG